MEHLPTTLKLLLEKYENAQQAIENLTGIDINNFNFKTKYPNKTPEYKNLNGIHPPDISCHDCGDSFYQSLIKTIKKPLEVKLIDIIMRHKVDILDKKSLFNALTTQAISSLPPVVRILCFFEARRTTAHMEYKDIFVSYPVLAQAIDNHLGHYFLILDTFLERLRSDTQLIKDKFNLNAIKVKSIKIGLGDFHKVGDGVIHLELSEKSLVYKTRSADNEGIVSCILDIMKSEKICGFIGIPKFINSVEYSWHDYIHFEDSDCIQDVKDFYKGAGAAISFFYAIGGMDFHYENIICSRKKPFFIDLECVFSGPVDFDVLSESILSTCIIPPLCGSPVEQFICGLGIRDFGEGHTYDSTFGFQKNGKKKQIPNHFNRPVALIPYISPGLIKMEIIDGFRMMVTALKKYRSTIVQLIQNYSSISGRVILRPTKFYSDIISISNHPRYSSEPFLRDCFIACALSQSNLPNEIIESEFISLKNGMIPSIYVDILKRKCHSKNKKNILYYESFRDIKKFTEHFLHFSSSAQDMKFHLKLISLSLDILFPEKPPLDINEKSGKKTSVNNALKFMLNTTLPYRGDAINLNLIKGEKGTNTYKLTIMDSSLYYGYGGGMFLKIVDYVSKPDKRKKIKILESYMFYNNMVRSDKDKHYGIFERNGTSIYINYLLFKYLSGELFLTQFERDLDNIVSMLIEKSVINVDIVGGVSGIIIVCCRMYKITASKKLFDIISTLVEMVISRAIYTDENKVSWGRKLTGFAHGNAGVTYALLLANELLGNKNISKISLKALSYENNFKIASGWKDLRINNSGVDFNSWCHGAPGIYLSRRAILDECPSITQEIRLIIREDIAHYHSSAYLREQNTDQSLCHGIYGNSIIEQKPETFSADFKNYTDEKSLMSGKIGAAYANLYFLCDGKDFPDLLLLK
ncbi:type 2 lanthipeptide synthetase LanM [Serratia marcescens]